MLRKRSSRAAFYAGTRRLQSELIVLPALNLTEGQCQHLAAELAGHGVEPREGPIAAEPAGQFCALLIHAHAALLREAGFHFPEPAELLPHPIDGSGIAIAVPKISCGGELSIELMQRLARLCLQTALQGASAEAWLANARQDVAKVRPPILAVVHMARAAYELEMPILEWHSVFLQAGHGRNAAALTGSITERTSSIGVHFAREKGKANELLARAGFPIARGGLVKDLAEAKRRAEAIGYPVVVKPADKDGGTAVSSDIQTPTELEQAYERARAVSRQIMLEEHVPGTDYRLLLDGDELLVALERTPGGVTGDGSSTIAELLDALNRERTGDGPSATLHPIVFDTEALLMLKRRGLTARSVPEKDLFVPLRRAANHALGGVVRRVDDIHADNIDLARRAMRLLRLDIAGIDLLLPDVTRSWREAGGAICEVNAQPFVGEVIGRDFYKAILLKLVPGGGRIPLALVVGKLDAPTLARLEAPGLTVIDGAGARRGGHPLSVEGMGWAHACQAALYDRETAAALCILDPDKAAPLYSPADRFSAAVVLDLPEGGATEELAVLLRRAGTEIHALPQAAKALKRAGIRARPIEQRDVAKTLAALLGGKPIRAAARAKPAPRGTAPPASRKRR